MFNARKGSIRATWNGSRDLGMERNKAEVSGALDVTKPSTGCPRKPVPLAPRAPCTDWSSAPSALWQRISARLLPADHALRLSTTDSACLASPRPPAPPPAAWRFSEGWAWQATRTSFWRHHALLAVFFVVVVVFSPLKWGSPKCMRSCWQFC